MKEIVKIFLVGILALAIVMSALTTVVWGWDNFIAPSVQSTAPVYSNPARCLDGGVFMPCNKEVAL